MNDNVQALISGYLDNMLTEHEEAELNSWIKAAPENAAAFADMVRFHDRLHDVMKAGEVIAEVSEPAEPDGQRTRATAPPRGRSWRRASLMGGVAALVTIAVAALWWSSAPQVSAGTELDRLIEKADTRDRSYVIHNLDAWPEQPEDRRPPIDGAILHVRQPDQYVLIRKFPDGQLFVTGSDGEHSWAVPPRGAVRISNDVLRFRGPVPGHQHGIPFLNLRSDLVQLRDAYVITALEPDVSGMRGLRAERKSRAYRGPRRVELWYDRGTGVIHRMVFHGMPRARGGPDSVSVELLNQRELGADFFKHEAHHAPDRRVIEED